MEEGAMRTLLLLALVTVMGTATPLLAKEKKLPKAHREFEQSKAGDDTYRTVTAKRHRKSYDDPSWGANWKQTMAQNEGRFTHSVMAR